MYDTLPSDPICPLLEEQLALLYKDLNSSVEDGGLTIHHVAVQLQTGTKDCGVLAIAIALHAALGHNLEEVTFNQRRLRKHLVDCFTEGRLTDFPVTSKKMIPRVVSKISFIPLYCHCRLPESFDDLVACEKCNKWYHHKCVQFENTHCGDWFCKHCV